jgi:hypothetical protein
MNRRTRRARVGGSEPQWPRSDRGGPDRASRWQDPGGMANGPRPARPTRGPGRPRPPDAGATASEGRGDTGWGRVDRAIAGEHGRRVPGAVRLLRSPRNDAWVHGPEATRAAASGASLLTVHARGGDQMVRAAVGAGPLLIVPEWVAGTSRGDQARVATPGGGSARRGRRARPRAPAPPGAGSRTPPRGEFAAALW